MRTEAFLSMLIMALAFASGALVLSIRNGPSLAMTAPVLQREVQKFRITTPVLDHLRTDGISEFIDPQNALPFFYKFDFQEVRDLRGFWDSCRATNSKKSMVLAKAWRWEELKCLGQKPGDEFFSRPPFLHPSGHSFAYLANKGSSWAKDHLALFHVSELRELNVPELPPPYLYLSSLERNSLSALAGGDPVVITDRFVFVDSRDDTGYAIYSRAAWDGFWAATPFAARGRAPAENCFIKDSSVCWSYDVKKAFFPRWNPLVFLLGLSILLAISVFVLLAARIYRRQQEQLRLKFTLEMLAHEIRTPATNLALAVESFRSNFDEFPERTKSGLLRLFDQVERIKRVAESSRNYLSNRIGADLIETNFSEIRSLRDFIHHTLDAYQSQIRLQINDRDASVVLDPYWTSICIKNLVENALAHGSRPVEVTVNQSGQAWSIEISDHGTERFDPMVKGERSAGFGLGFKIVKNIVPLLHASLEISYHPTRVVIFFGERR